MTAAARSAAVERTAVPARFDADWLAGHLRALIGPLRGRRLCVAFSGGMDSSVLLTVLAALRARERLSLRALHVDHHLHPDSGRWAAGAGAWARRLRVPFECLPAAVRRRRGESPEAAARAVRYRALRAALRPGELLLTAHHGDDQLETVLLALLRGGGVRGLAGMSGVSAWSGAALVRPLLPVPRAELERYARDHGLAWSEDPSNRDERFDRNYLRHRLLPPIRARWPAAVTTIGRSAAHLAEAEGLLAQLAQADLAAARDGTALRVSVLSRLTPPRRRNALRHWIAECGLPSPDHRRLREIAGPMLRSRADALPVVRWQGGELCRHGDRLVALRGSSADLAAAAGAGGAGSLSWDWRRQPWLRLADGSELGLVREPHGDVRLAALPRRLRISFRQGGERLGVEGGRLALKDLLQAAGLPPWQRARVPLIGAGGRVIAVADLWLDPSCRAGATDRPARARGRGRFRWRRPADR